MKPLRFLQVTTSCQSLPLLWYPHCLHIHRDGELVLVDAGADYHGYVSDITRTWPVNGCFTSPQCDLYSALLEVQEAAVRVSGGVV